MSDITTLMMGAAGAGGGAETDPNFNQTTLLLHGDGTNGAQNNTFLDSSTNNFTITRNGNTTQGTFSPFSNADGEWSGYFAGGATSYIQTDGTTLFDQNAAATFQCWIYPTQFLTSTSAVRRMYIFVKGVIFAGLSIHSDGTLGWYGYPAGSIITSSPSGTIVTNEWQHIAIVMNPSSNYIKLYKNGVEVGTSAYSAYGTNGAALRIGIGDTGQSGTDAFIGYMSNVKVSASVATLDYASPPVPSTTSGAGLLTLQANRFYDASGNRTVTPYAAVSIQPFSPFAPSAAYSASVNGGSGYFDGSGDYLAIPYNSVFNYSSSIPFTVEFWFYPTVSGTDNAQWAASQNGGTDPNLNWLIRQTSSNKIRFVMIQSGGTVVTNDSTDSFQLNAWNHFAAVMTGSATKTWVNGVYQQSVAFNGSQQVNGNISLGVWITHATGYMASFRYVVNSQVYTGTSNITVPTAPLTAISNTQLLTNFTNAGIFDNTGKNNLETVGNAQIDTSVKKYGTGSMEFDGTGDWLVSPSNSLYDLNGDFTIEFWIYLNSLSGNPTPIDRAYTGSALDSNGYLIQYGSSALKFYGGGSSITSSQTDSTSTWFHYAIVRSGSTITMYRNGTSVGSATISTAFTYARELSIGGNSRAGGGFAAGQGAMNGYIDDLRITKGVARYTTTFTPPDAPFPDQ